ncbi:HAD family hydrolase [Desulfovibrio inopinatus]|uniref:HAD family hydrolase n=1 Tax=Desulfovibrio inopinatus TaxID=102109 RepID=UPI0003FEC460|nr:HAD family hydrolase [Desulfovibrio inopinatus]
MSARFIDKFDVLLFDVQQTIMFGGDRFAATEDFYGTYRRCGGSHLSPENVQSAILRCFDYLMHRYTDAKFFDCFPSLEEAFNASCPDLRQQSEEVGTLVKTFACHECGCISDGYAECIQELAKTHQLGVVSNIWAKKDNWIQVFERKGILDCFETLIFSSDFRSIKPSVTLFHEAMRSFPLSKERVVFVGDSLAYDIAGAKSAGIKAILITNKTPISQRMTPEPDFVVPDLYHLLKLNKDNRFFLSGETETKKAGG